MGAGEFRLVAAAMNESRRRMGFLLCGYVLMPDHWHALISTDYPLTISRVIQNIKWISARSLNGGRRASGLVSKPEQWRWSSYNNFALEKVTVRRCPLRVDYIRLSESYRG